MYFFPYSTNVIRLFSASAAFCSIVCAQTRGVNNIRAARQAHVKMWFLSVLVMP